MQDTGRFGLGPSCPRAPVAHRDGLEVQPPSIQSRIIENDSHVRISSASPAMGLAFGLRVPRQKMHRCKLWTCDHGGPEIRRPRAEPRWLDQPNPLATKPRHVGGRTAASKQRPTLLLLRRTSHGRSGPCVHGSYGVLGYTSPHRQPGTPDRLGVAARLGIPTRLTCLTHPATNAGESGFGDRVVSARLTWVREAGAAWFEGGARNSDIGTKAFLPSISGSLRSWNIQVATGRSVLAWQMLDSSVGSPQSVMIDE